MRRFIVAAALLGLGLLAWHAHGLWAFGQAMQQHVTSMEARALRVRLLEFKRAHGSLPADLREVIDDGETLPRDKWGRVFRYERSGEAFLLLSAGSDGYLEFLNYWDARELPVAERNGMLGGPIGFICGDHRGDIIFSDRGAHRWCYVK